jgi:hypothetical protein
MKNVLFLVFIFISVNVYSQEKIFNKFVLGVDSIESISNKIDINFELNVDTEYDGKVETDKITYYQVYNGRFVLLLINNKLFGVKFYPDNDKIYYKHLKLLNSKYETKMIDKAWYNSKTLILYHMDNNYDEAFVYYDIKMLEKYPEYKNF